MRRSLSPKIANHTNRFGVTPEAVFSTRIHERMCAYGQRPTVQLNQTRTLSETPSRPRGKLPLLKGFLRHNCGRTHSEPKPRTGLSRYPQRYRGERRSMLTKEQREIIMDGIKSGASQLDLATVRALMECENAFDAIESSIGRSTMGGITRVKKEAK